VRPRQGAGGGAPRRARVAGHVESARGAREKVVAWQWGCAASVSAGNARWKARRCKMSSRDGRMAQCRHFPGRKAASCMPKNASRCEGQVEGIVLVAGGVVVAGAQLQPRNNGANLQEVVANAVPNEPWLQNQASLPCAVLFLPASLRRARAGVSSRCGVHVMPRKGMRGVVMAPVTRGAAFFATPVSPGGEKVRVEEERCQRGSAGVVRTQANSRPPVCANGVARLMPARPPAHVVGAAAESMADSTHDAGRAAEAWRHEGKAKCCRDCLYTRDIREMPPALSPQCFV